MIRIITDSASDVVGNKREDLRVLPVSITFGEEEFQDGINLTHQMFYEKLIECDELPVTSQVPPFAFEKAFREAMETGNQVIAITLSSKLSGTWQSACIAAEGFGGKVRVVDSENASIGQHALVEYALRLKDAGLGIEEIVERLEADKKRISLIALLDTLEYLKKGGRITPAAAALGTLLRIKPVLQIQGEKLDAFAKVRGWKAAKRTMLQAIEKDIKERFAGKESQLILGMAYTCGKEEAAEWKEEIHSHFPEYEIMENPLSLSIACHIGAGAMAVTCTKKV